MLVIGDDNIIRENCIIYWGMVQDCGEICIGNGNLFMVYVHVAYDCIIGNNIILVNCVTLAGHVFVGDFVILGGGIMVHQFCHIGIYSMSVGGSIVLKDIFVYIMVSG